MFVNCFFELRDVHAMAWRRIWSYATGKNVVGLYSDTASDRTAWWKNGNK